jgi:NAD(P)-dependent dehydrogenase (short-subunit alcohol dehydrogenase family)
MTNVPDVQFIRPAADQTVPGPLVVTGAARGIGNAVARLAVAAGVAVALLDRDAAELEAIAAELEAAAAELGSSALALACDVSDETQVDAAFAWVADRLGTPAGVVVSAGIDRGAPLHEFEAAIWDEVLAVNLRGAFLTCRAAVRQMLPSGRGAIVCVSSPFGFVSAAGGTSAYSSSKAGVSALARTLAVEYGSRGIRVNAILPGPTETDLMWANVPPEEVDRTREIIQDEVPLGRLADPEEPARAALWLLSDQASYVTGAQLACDGGVLAKASISV